MKKLPLLVYLILLASPLLGIDLNFKVYQVEDGLSSNTVYDIMQDNRGFMWIGTEDGLNRFDGHEFRCYRNIPRDTTSISSNYIYKLFESADGNIWVGTEKGICIYNPSKDHFHPFNLTTPEGVAVADRIQHFIPDGNGLLWIAGTTQGLFLYNAQTESLKQYDFVEYRSSEHDLIYTTCLFKDRAETLWALVTGTRHQIYKYNRQRETFEPAFPDMDEDTSRKLASYSMLEDTFGSLWLGTWNNGVYKIDRTTGIKANYLNTEGVDKVLHIHSMMEYEPGKFFIGSNDGLTVLSGAPVKGYRREVHMREPAFVYPVYRDREGGLWIGTYYGGIYYASPNRNYFTGYTHNEYVNSVSGNVVSVFCEDKAGNIWIGTDDGGLNYFDTKTERFTVYKPEKDKNSLSFHNIHALCLDNNELWIGTYTGGINVLDLATRRFRYYHCNPADTTTVGSNSTYALYKDTRGQIWAGTMEGIDLYDRQKDSFRRMRKNNHMTVAIEQADSTMWFAVSGDGLLAYHLPTATWKQYLHDPDNFSSIISNNVLCLCVDEDGVLWVGTNSGLCKYNSETDEFTLVSNGFRNEAICKIFSDNNHLWITTTKGLIDYDPRLNRHRFFTKEDGLSSEQFIVNSGLKTRSGKIYIGTTNGFNTFYPKQITTNRHIPPIAITDFQLFNRSVAMDRYITYDKNNKPRIVLPYNKNSFGFDFTALSYYAPEKNEYAFYLEGFDRYWNYVGNKRKSTYTNIPPGEYNFRVRASNNDGLWNNDGIAIKLVITPPFWLTKFFICLYILLGITLLYGIWLYLKRRNERKNNARIEQIKNEQEKEAYTSKINFFTTIAHEIRTPVSLIIGPLEQIIQSTEWFSEKVKDDLDIINRNSQRLLSLVNQLLDFRKIERGTLPVSFTEQNVHELLKSIYIRFKSYMENRKITLTFTATTENLIACVDMENLTKMVSNLLNNASKFAKSEIELHLSADNDARVFRIIVRDDGCGISPEQQEHIFKPFYQVPGTQAGGTGLGLYLVKSIVDACHGELEIDSSPGRGSSFIITLPITQQTDAVFTEQLLPATLPEEEITPPIVEQPAPLEDTANGNRPVLLIVEDNEEMSSFLRKSFAESYHILTAANGVEGIKTLEKNQVDLIISDIMMPEMDGIEFCAQVKTNLLWNHIPLILLTAKTTIDTKIEAMEQGADAYVDKPFSVSFLLAQARNLLESRRKLMRKYTEAPYASLKSIAGNKMDEKFLVKVNDVIEQNIANVDFTMDQLAEELNISSSGLFAKIKSLSGMTPNKLLLLVRLKKAAELLQENRYRVNEVCYMVGFNNPSYFAKCFQKQYGILPKDFGKK